jgi:hypothetical protein
MKQNILSLFITVFLLAQMHIFTAETALSCKDVSNFNEQLYRSLVYVNKDARESIAVLNHLLPEHPWSTTCKRVCLDIQDEVNVMPCKDVACVVDECLEACKNFPHEKIETIQSELTQYKEILHAGQAHVCNWKNDDDAYKIVTRNFDGSREILQLYTRNLTVDGIETVNGLLTVNGIIALNGRLILNGVDINTVIANAAAAASGGGGGVTSVTGGTGINITGTTTAPIVNLTIPVAIANGGTNATSMTTTDGTVIFDGTRLVTTATGTANQVLTSNGPGFAPTYQDVSASGAVTAVTGGNNITVTGPNTARVVNVSGTTNHAVQVGNSTGSLTSIPNGTTGQVLTAQTGADPIWTSTSAASGIVTIDGDTGNVTGATVGIKSNLRNGAGASISFSGDGTNLSLSTTDGLSNNFFGLNSGTSIVSGSLNVACGVATLANILAGSNNCAYGYESLINLTSGNNNTAVGFLALPSLLTGVYNVGLGSDAGSNYNTSEGSNIAINSPGVTGESHVLRIGSGTGTGNQQLNKSFIFGIRGITTGVADALPVLIDSASQLGTTSSSKRFKENIVPMPSSFSDNLLQLNPTLFNYKQDESKKQTWGLIAEEVQQIFPELVVNDQDGLPLTVKYHEMPVLLLNELIKLKNECVEMKKENVEIKKELENLKKGTL